MNHDPEMKMKYDAGTGRPHSSFEVKVVREIDADRVLVDNAGFLFVALKSRLQPIH